jgi:hypothetical protein
MKKQKAGGYDAGRQAHRLARPVRWVGAFALIHLRSVHQRFQPGNTLPSCMSVESRLDGYPRRQAGPSPGSLITLKRGRRGRMLTKTLATDPENVLEVPQQTLSPPNLLT